ISWFLERQTPGVTCFTVQTEDGASGTDDLVAQAATNVEDALVEGADLVFARLQMEDLCIDSKHRVSRWHVLPVDAHDLKRVGHLNHYHLLLGQLGARIQFHVGLLGTGRQQASKGYTYNATHEDSFLQ